MRWLPLVNPPTAKTVEPPAADVPRSTLWSPPTSGLATTLQADRYRRLDEVLAEIDGVTGDAAAAVAAEYFAPERWSVVRLGPDTEARE